MSLLVEPVMVNVSPPAGIGLDSNAGVSLYVNVLLTGEPENVNTCFTGNIISPGTAAFAVTMHKPIRTAGIKSTERVPLTIRFQNGDLFIFNFIALLMPTISVTGI